MRLTIRALLLLLLCQSAPSWAQGVHLRVAGGLTVELQSDGKIDWLGPTVIPLDDGRTLKRIGERTWQIEPATTDEVKQLAPIDLAVYHRDYEGKRVRFTGEIYDVTVWQATVHLPGSVYARLSLNTVPRDVVKDLILKCGGIPFGKRPACTMQITGTMAANSEVDSFILNDLMISAPTNATAGSRPKQ